MIYHFVDGKRLKITLAILSFKYIIAIKEFKWMVPEERRQKMVTINKI
jgi:hypothetical protein